MNDYHAKSVHLRKNLVCKYLALLIMIGTPSYAGSGWLDWVPERKNLKYCDTKLTDVIGAASLGVTALAAAGATVTTITMSPAMLLIAGESSLTFLSGTALTVVSTPVIATTGAVTATAVSVAYGGGKTLCKLSEFLENNYITNESITLIDLHKPIKWDVSDKDGFASGEYRFVKTDEVIPMGTPVFSLGPLSEDAAKHYPNYNGRGLIQLGRFYNHGGYPTKRSEDELGFAVVPANSLNPIMLKKYTHVLLEDTLVEENGETKMLPAGFPFQLLKVRKDDWAKIELTTGFNLWLKNFSLLKTEKLSEIIQ